MQLSWNALWFGVSALASEPAPVHHSAVEVVEWVAPEIEGEVREGEVCMVSLTIDSQGRPSAPQFEECNPKLRTATQVALKSWRFAPHEVEGSPVAIRTTLPIVFEDPLWDLPPLARYRAAPAESEESEPSAPEVDQDVLAVSEESDVARAADQLERLGDALRQEILVVGETAEVLDELFTEETLSWAWRGKSMTYEGWVDRVKPVLSVMPDVHCAAYVRSDWNVHVVGDCETTRAPSPATTRAERFDGPQPRDGDAMPEAAIGLGRCHWTPPLEVTSTMSSVIVNGTRYDVRRRWHAWTRQLSGCGLHQAAAEFGEWRRRRRAANTWAVVSVLFPYGVLGVGLNGSGARSHRIAFEVALANLDPAEEEVVEQERGVDYVLTAQALGSSWVHEPGWARKYGVATIDGQCPWDPDRYHRVEKIGRSKVRIDSTIYAQNAGFESILASCGELEALVHLWEWRTHRGGPKGRLGRKKMVVALRYPGA
jgi:hypothetical protein